MNRLKLIDSKGLKLLEDPINQKIVESLIQNELSVKELSRKFNTPLTTMWRRVKALEKAGILEVTRKKKTKNIEIKYYRATAALYLAKDLLTSLPIPSYTPKSKEVKELYERYLKIAYKVLDEELKYNTVPENVDPIDYAILLDIYSNCKILTSQDTVSELKELLKRTEDILRSVLEKRREQNYSLQ